MLIPFLIMLAIILRMVAGASYFWATFTGRARPNIVSWFFWGVTPMIAFAVQLHEGMGWRALPTLVLGLSPLAICALAVFKNRGNLTFSHIDKVSAFSTIAAILMWIITDNPLLALSFSIAGDMCSNIPTIIKSLRDPASEYPYPYFLSMLSMIVTLITIREWDVAQYAFTAYILAVNAMYFSLIYWRIGPRLSGRRSLLKSRLS